MWQNGEKFTNESKLQNSKDNAESPEFVPVLGLFIFMKKSVATTT